jgi:cytochrome c553
MSSEDLLRSVSWLFRIAAALFLAWLLLHGHAAAAPPDPKGASAPAPAAGGAADAAEAKAQGEAREVYASTCVSCHGQRGAGDGLAAMGLPAKPASFADAAWQAQTSDRQIERVIVGGGAAIGKSPLMPANPGLASKPQVVAALRTMIRGFAGSAPR